MNFHPSVLAQTALLEKPKSREELNVIIGLIEEKFAVTRERQRMGNGTLPLVGGGPRPHRPPPGAPSPAGSLRCWACGLTGHISRDCPAIRPVPGNGQRPEGGLPPCRNFEFH